VGDSLAFDAAWLFAAFILVLVLAAAFLATRRYLLERGGGTVECGLRRIPEGESGGNWRLGVAQYELEELHWFSAFGISARPEEILPRRDLTMVSRRVPDEGEEAILGSGRIIVSCDLPHGSVELALAESALTGLLVWLEAAPPGSHLGWASLACRSSGNFFITNCGGTILKPRTGTGSNITNSSRSKCDLRIDLGYSQFCMRCDIV
jgi:hypothetical protein